MVSGAAGGGASKESQITGWRPVLLTMQMSFNLDHYSVNVILPHRTCYWVSDRWFIARRNEDVPCPPHGACAAQDAR
jgi:hypothetical protein